MPAERPAARTTNAVAVTAATPASSFHPSNHGLRTGYVLRRRGRHDPEAARDAADGDAGAGARSLSRLLPELRLLAQSSGALLRCSATEQPDPKVSITHKDMLQPDLT